MHAMVTLPWISRVLRPRVAAMQADVEIDALGLLCPLPVLKARKRLKSMGVGEVLCLHADDPAAIVDVPHFCAEAGHELLDSRVEGPACRYFIRKAPAAG